MARNSASEGRSPFPALDVTTTGHRRIGALTGVRWWAAFGVLLSHTIPGGGLFQ